MRGVSKPTILKLIRDLGFAREVYHDEHVGGLRREHVQTNEIRPFNYEKAKNIATAKNAPPETGDCWIRTAIDWDSKMVAHRVGLRTNARSKKLESHVHAVAMFFMFYNFCRVHSTIGTSPAVASGIADHVWTIEELVGLLP